MEKPLNKVIKIWQTVNRIDQPNQEVKLDIIKQIASTFAAGPYYYYVFNYTNLEFDYVDETITEVLGISPKDFSVHKFFEYLHPDDQSIFSKKQNSILSFQINKLGVEELPFYKSQHLLRFKNTKGVYKLILHQSIAINVTANGKPQQILVINTDISHLNIPYSTNVSLIGLNNRPSFFFVECENGYMLKDKHLKDFITIREKEIITKLAEGRNFKQIAEELFISPNTVNTHKRNILRKAECKNTAELVGKCISEGVI